MHNALPIDLGNHTGGGLCGADLLKTQGSERRGISGSHQGAFSYESLEKRRRWKCPCAA